MEKGKIVQIVSRDSAFFGWKGTVAYSFPEGFGVDLIGRSGTMWFFKNEIGVYLG